MIIYLIAFFAIIIIPFCLRLSKRISSEKLQWFISIYCFSIIFLLLAFKNISVGTDSRGYFETYTSMSSKTWKSVFDVRTEFGFYALMKLFSSLSLNYYFFQFFYYLITIFPFVLFARKYSRYPELFALGVYSFDLFNFMGSALRQAGAIGIALLGAFYWFSDKKWKILPFLFFVTIAATFHHSALAFLLVPFLSKTKITWKSFLVVIIPAYIIALILDPFAYEALYPYINQYYPGINNTSIPAFSVVLLLGAFFLILLSPVGIIPDFRNSAIKSKLYVGDNDGQRNADNLFINVFFQCIPFIILASFAMELTVVTNVGTRIAYFFLPFLAMSLSEFPVFFKGRKTKSLMMALFCVVMLAFFSYTFLWKDPLNEVPYSVL